MAFSIAELDGTSLISTVNSSSTPLGANATFTGVPEDISRFAQTSIVVFSDQSSGIDGLSVEFSSDGTNWDWCDTFTVPANTGKIFSVGVIARYFRVQFINGATAQSEFRLQVLHHLFPFKSSTHTLKSLVDKDDDAELTRSVISAQRPGGDFGNVGATLDGRLLVDSTVTVNLEGEVVTTLQNNGSADLSVNGSTTPIEFTFAADSDNDVELLALVVVLEDANLKTGNNFMGLGALTNGLTFDGKFSNVAATFTTMRRTRDIISFSTSGDITSIIEANALVSVRHAFPPGVFVRRAGTFATDDFIRVSVRDNLSNLIYGECRLLGVKR